MRIVPRSLPSDALPQAYRVRGAHTDCYTAEVPGSVALAEFIAAFYSSWAFWPERVFIGLALGMRAGPREVADLAGARTTRFSAWTVEAREADQILLCDFQQRTRSWLMVAPGNARDTTRLYFGTVVVRIRKSRAARFGEAAVFDGLLWFHELYSRLLLWSAARRLLR